MQNHLSQDQRNSNFSKAMLKQIAWTCNILLVISQLLLLNPDSICNRFCNMWSNHWPGLQKSGTKSAKLPTRPVLTIKYTSLDCETLKNTCAPLGSMFGGYHRTRTDIRKLSSIYYFQPEHIVCIVFNKIYRRSLPELERHRQQHCWNYGKTEQNVLPLFWALLWTVQRHLPWHENIGSKNAYRQSMITKKNA